MQQRMNGRSTHTILVRTYRLPEDLVQRLDALSACTRICQSKLLAHLLTRGMNELDAGRWQIRTRPIAYEIDPE